MNLRGRKIGSGGCHSGNAGARFCVVVFLVLGSGLALLNGTAPGAQAQASAVISQIVPSSGPTTGGNVVRLLGSGFTSTTGVWFWANQATVAKFVSANELDVIAPAHNVTGPVDVVAGTYRANGSYTYTTAVTPLLTANTSSLKFGNVTVGSYSTQVVTIKSAGTAPAVISSVSLSGTGFSIVAGSLAGVPLTSVVYPVTLNPNTTATITLQYKPSAAGTSNGAFTIYSNSSSGSALVTSLTGSGVGLTVPHLSITPAAVSLGSVAMGQSGAQSITLTSSGTAPVVVSSATVSGAGFSVSGMTLPATLAVGQKVSLLVQFKPASVGAISGRVAITSNDPAGAAVATLSASGIATSMAGTPLSSCGDLTQSGSYYLTQNVTSSGTCFFVDANNISLNLNGHTITYGTGGGAAGTPGILLADTWYTGGGSFSLAKTGSTDSHGGFEVYNGTIQSSPAAAPQSRGIWVGQSSDISPAPKVHDLKINTTAVDANPIFGDSSLSGWQIYNNYLNYGATGSGAISSRYALLGYAIWLADTLNAPGIISDQIYSNHVLAAPQGGIYDTNQNALIHDNVITFNSYFTNDYCVAAVSGNGAVITYNTCAPTSGRGYDIEASNVTLSGNTATVTELAQNAEYGGCELGGADGIRIKDNYNTPGGGAPTPPSGAVVTGNVITVSATVCPANALRLSFLYPGDTAHISGNTFTSTGGAAIDFAVSFDQVTSAPITFSGNIFSAHLAHVQIDYDGVVAGMIQSGQTWAGTPTYSIYDIDGGADAANPTHPGLSSLTVDDKLPMTKLCGSVSHATLSVGGTNTTCP